MLFSPPSLSRSYPLPLIQLKFLLKNQMKTQSNNKAKEMEKTHTHTHAQGESSICWSTIPEHKACPELVDKLYWRKLSFPLPAGIIDSSVNLYPCG